MAVQAVTESNFQAEVLTSELPVLMCLYVEGHAGCKLQLSAVDQAAIELDGQIKAVRVDVDKSPRLAASLQVKTVPQVFLIHQGEVAAHLDRPADKATLLKMVEPFLPRDGASVKPAELDMLIKQKRALAVDVRDSAVYARYRIPGAINVPSMDLADKKGSLAPSDGRIRVLYGRTDEGKDAAKTLEAAGVQVGFLAGGFLAWESDGLPIEKGTPTG